MLSHFKFALPSLLLVASASAAPKSAKLLKTTQNVNVDTSSYCGIYFRLENPRLGHLKVGILTLGRWDTVSAGAYSLSLDQWGKDDAISGGSCASLISLNGATVAWHSTWNWAGGDQIKSFAHIQLNQGINTALSKIHSIPVGTKNTFFLCVCC